jgi:hypothetical protein
MLANNTNIRNIVNNHLELINDFNNKLKKKLRQFLQKFNDNDNDNIRIGNNIYKLYDSIQIITLLIYMLKLNPNVFQHVEQLNFNTLNYILNVDFLIRKHRQICILIDIYIESKFVLLKRSNFYTQEKLNRLKVNLAKKYREIPPDSTMFQPKFERSFDPKKIDMNEEKYQLQYEAVRNQLNPDNFEFREKLSTFVLSKNDAIETKSTIVDIFADIYNQIILRNHFTSYNATIKKIRANGLITTDFDLMRSKFNIIINNSQIIYKNREEHQATIPSEFIDVSIPRFEDDGRKKFFLHICSHNFYPVYLELGNANKRIFTYSPTETLEDLVYLLTEKNLLEPWLDKKYGKRLTRMIVLFIMDLVYKNTINPDLRSQNYDKYKNFIKLSYVLNNYLEGNINNYPSHIFASFLIGYNQDNIDDINNINLENYLNTFNNFSQQWLINNEIPQFYINHDYIYVKKLIQHLIIWGSLYNFTDETLVKTLNLCSKTYLQTPSHNLDNINETKRKFIKLLSIIYNIGFKLLYFITPYQEPERINIEPPQRQQHGGNKYEIIFRKYLKYKNKYLNKK